MKNLDPEFWITIYDTTETELAETVLFCLQFTSLGKAGPAAPARLFAETRPKRLIALTHNPTIMFSRRSRRSWRENQNIFLDMPNYLGVACLNYGHVMTISYALCLAITECKWKEALSLNLRQSKSVSMESAFSSVETR